MITDAPYYAENKDGTPIRGITAEGLKMLCFRLAMITNTSVEFYFKLPYNDLLKFVKELEEQIKRRKK